MRFTFIHTADWQIGKLFGGFDARLAGRLEAARLDAIDRLAEVAAQHGAAHVLVAGDVYDAPDLKERTLRQPLSRMGAHRDITWILLPGNHDPAGPGSVWERVRRLGPPHNIIIADEPKPIMLGSNAVILPAPLAAKAMSSDPTVWMDRAEPAEAILRIGLAHGAAHGFGSEGECAVPIDPGRVASARLDYLALGDWHGMKRIADRCWYSGTPEPDNFANNPKGHALVVTFDSADRAAAPVVTPVATGHFTWAKLDTRISSATDIPALERDISALTTQPSRLLLNMKLAGALTLEGHAALATWRANLDGRLQHLVCDDREVELVGDLDPATLEELAGTDPELRTVIERLDALAQASATAPTRPRDEQEPAAASEQRAIARTALLRLIDFARAEAGEGA